MQPEQKLIEQERINQSRQLGRSLRAITFHQKVDRLIIEALQIDGFVECGSLTAAGKAKLSDLRRRL